MKVKATFFMRVFNVEESMLRRAIESILNQTERNFRFIIQDNGSTDGSNKIIKEYADQDERINWFRNEINGNATKEEWQEREEALYKNFQECDSQYFAFIDSDDYYQPEFLEKAYNLADSQNADIIFTGYQQVNVGGTVITTKIPPSIVCTPQSMTEDIFINEYPMIRTLWGSLYSKKLWRRYWYLLDVDRPAYMRNGLDTYINLKLLTEIERFASINECLYSQTIRGNSVYNLDLRPERVLEADCLFTQGIELAKFSGILNEQMIIFLASCYYYHIEDIVKNILKDKRQQQSIGHMNTFLQESKIFNMLAEKNRELQELLLMLN